MAAQSPPELKPGADLTAYLGAAIDFIYRTSEDMARKQTRYLLRLADKRKEMDVEKPDSPATL